MLSDLMAPSAKLKGHLDITECIVQGTLSTAHFYIPQHYRVLSEIEKILVNLLESRFGRILNKGYIKMSPVLLTAHFLKIGTIESPGMSQN